MLKSGQFATVGRDRVQDTLFQFPLTHRTVCTIAWAWKPGANISNVKMGVSVPALTTGNFQICKSLTKNRSIGLIEIRQHWAHTLCHKELAVREK